MSNFQVQYTSDTQPGSSRTKNGLRRRQLCLWENDSRKVIRKRFAPITEKKEKQTAAKFGKILASEFRKPLDNFTYRIF